MKVILLIKGKRVCYEVATYQEAEKLGEYQKASELIIPSQNGSPRK